MFYDFRYHPGYCIKFIKQEGSGVAGAAVIDVEDDDGEVSELHQGKLHECIKPLLKIELLPSTICNFV